MDRLAKAACAALVGAVAGHAKAASWDPFPGVVGGGDGVINGGSGLWNTFAPNWTNDGGVTNTPWVNFDTASFGGVSGGIVGISDGGVTAGSLTFDPTSNFSLYTIQSQTTGDVLTLAGGGQITTNQDATINAIIGGSAGLTKQGAGTLTLGGLNNFSGSVNVTAGRLRINDIGNLGAANSVAISGGATLAVGNAMTYFGAVSTAGGGGTIALTNPATTLTLAGTLAGSDPLTIDGTGGGTLLVTNPANFNGFGNLFTGNVTLNGGGAATFAHGIQAQFGQIYWANAGTLTLGNSVSGAVVGLSPGSLVLASGGGVVQLSGRANGFATGVNVAGNLTAISGGRIVVGDGLDDSAQIQFANTSQLNVDGGSLVLRPRAVPLSLDFGTVGALAIRNGGMLALGGNADLVLNRDVDQSGAWVLANQSANTFRITGFSQDSTAGLTLRADSGVTRYEVDTITLGNTQASGTLAVDLRGGTIDINNNFAGKTFNYAPGYTVAGWGQLGTSAANQTHVIPLGGATFYANAPAAVGGTLCIVGGFNESFGSKASFRIGDNNALMLTMPNVPAAPYSVGSVLVDPQGAGSVARFVVGAGGAISANTSAFTNANNRVRFEVQSGATLTSDVSSTGSLLVNTPGSVPINVIGGGTFVTRASTFLLQPSETIGTTGTLFGFNGTTVTTLTLNGLVDLNGTLGGPISAASTGTIKLDAGDALTLTAGADLSAMQLAYAGAGAGSALLEVNAPASTVRIGTATGLTTPFGAFGGTREFKVTGGTLQVDAADASSVSISGVNQLSVDRTNNGVPDPALVGTLTLSGGAFQVGTGASTNTVTPGGLLVGRGTVGHATAVDTFVNFGTVRASGGPLAISATALRGNGAWDPNGQTITFNGAFSDFAGGTSQTTLRVVGAAGGTVQLAQASTYTGGTVVDGSAGAGAVALKVIAAGALGSGPVTLNGGLLQIFSESSLTFTNAINVTGTATSSIGFEHLTSASSKTETVGPLTLGGQTLLLAGPPTSAYTYTLTIGGTTVGPAGATIVNSGGSSSGVNTGALTLNGNLNLATTSTKFNVDALSGTGSITRNSATGTVVFAKAANGYSGNYFASVGTTNFNASNTLGTGTYTFANGTYNVNAGAALSGAAGSMQLGSLNLNAANALDGTSLNFTGGNLFTTFAGSLGTGTIQLNGGKMFLRSDAGAVFGGTINVTGIAGTNNAGSLTVDRATAAGTGGVQTVSALNITNQSLNVIAGNAGYGLSVSGATTVGGSTGGTLTNNASVINLSSLTLNAPLTITGGGNMSIGALGGASLLNLTSSGTTTFTSPAQAGFTGPVVLTTGTANVTNAASFVGGSVTVNGGILNVGVANALAGTSATLSSGFLNANVSNALNGATLPIVNGTLFAAVNNALGNATINMSGGNLTATAPGALGASNISLSSAILALRGDAAASFGGNVTLTGSGFSTVSVAKLTDAGGTGNNLSINNLTLGGQTLNVTGADNDVFTVVNPVTMTGTSTTTINTTAADALFQGALSGSGAVIKNGVRSLRLDNGGTFGATTVNAGTLIVNNAWTTSGVTVGGTSGAATLQLGGAGTNAPGIVTVNAGTLRIAKANIAGAIPAASALTVGTNGDVRVEYAGQTASTLANNITVDTSLAARTLTLAATSGTLVSQGSTFTVSGQIVKSGANALNVVVQADTALDDGFNALVRPPSRLVLGPNQTFTTDLQHNGGIVIGKGTVPAGTTASPFGLSANPLNMNVVDSTIGGMVADGTSSSTFSKVVNTAAASPRKRLGAFYNPAGLVGAPQTVNFNGSFTWNDGTTPLYVMIPAGNVGGAAAVSPWNGIIVDPGAMLQVNSGAVLDNILTSTASAVTSVAPVYVGGGGTVRFTTGITRTLSQAKGLAGTVTVLDNTTFQSNTTGTHFDGVELRSGSYQVGATTAQALAGGFAVNASPFDPSRTTSNLITDVDLGLTGVGPAAAFKIGAGQTLVKTGAGALNVNGDQLHAINATLQVNQGVVNLNTDAGMNNGGTPVNNLSLAASNGAIANMAVTQHLSQLTASGNALVKLSSTGTRAIDATSVSATTGKVDLTTNRLIVDYGAGFASSMPSIRQQIVSGYNAAGTLWGGNGITSSSAAATPFSVGLGYAEASDVLGPTGGVFGGENVDGSSVLVRYTKLGDANLDGAVDFLDLARLAQNYNATVSTTTDSWWARGDFTYDGIVDFNDLAKLAQNYNTALPSGAVPSASADFSADLAAAFAQVPEPGTVGVVTVLGAAGLLRRGRRRLD